MGRGAGGAGRGGGVTRGHEWGQISLGARWNKALGLYTAGGNRWVRDEEGGWVERSYEDQRGVLRGVRFASVHRLRDGTFRVRLGQRDPERIIEESEHIVDSWAAAQRLWDGYKTGFTR